MSVENFQAHYPVHEVNLKVAVGIYKDRRSLRNSSQIGILAYALVDDASSGLRELMKPLSGSGLTFKPDQIMRLGMSEKQRVAVAIHHASIMFGLSIIAIEDSLISRVFDAQEFLERYNLAISGTLFEPGYATRGVVFQMSPAQMGKMYACAGRDRTLMGFFRDEGINIMPTPLSEMLRLSRGLPHIRATIIPFFQPRAKLFLA